MVAGAVTALALGGAMPAVSMAARSAAAGVAPHAIGGLDCNGLSPVQRPVKQGMMCADPRGSDGGRFVDNGHYIGHDEPSVRFLSSVPGSGNNMSITEKLPADPEAAPTVAHPGRDVTHWFELSLAPWISTTVCDPESAPLLPCNPALGRERAARQLPGRRRRLRRIAVLPARVRTVRGQHQLR